MYYTLSDLKEKIQNTSTIANIVIDVDLTIFNTDQLWFIYLNEKYKEIYGSHKYKSINEIENPNYNLTELFKELIEDNHLKNPFEFFDFKKTYCDVTLIDDNIPNIIEQLYQLNNNIIFSSYCGNNLLHTQYKIEALKRNFNFLCKKNDFNFVATKEKGILKADCVIDDRIEYLNQFQPKDTYRILLDTPYEQCEYLNKLKSFSVVSNWSDIEFLLIEQNRYL